MARGPKKHLKRVNAPKSWLMNKMGGNFAVRPSQGPHKLRESVPLQVVLRDKLNLALNGREANVILHQKEGLVKVDKKLRRDPKFGVGLMDVIDIPKMGISYRVLYDVKGRFVFVKLPKNENAFKLCTVTRVEIGPNKIPYVITHDGRTIRFTNREIKIHDTLKYNLEKNEIEDFYHMAVGNIAFVSNGNNKGRVGKIVHISHLKGMFDLVTMKDDKENTFTTRINYVTVIGKGDKSVITLPKEKGLKLSILEESDARAEASK